MLHEAYNRFVGVSNEYLQQLWAEEVTLYAPGPDTHVRLQAIAIQRPKSNKFEIVVQIEKRISFNSKAIRM